MSLNEETITTFDQYKDKIKALEDAGPSKARVVFCFEQAEGNPQLYNALNNAKKAGIKDATLIHVKITKAEMNSPNNPWTNAPKFKVVKFITY